jgi:hypothetical protein
MSGLKGKPLKFQHLFLLTKVVTYCFPSSFTYTPIQFQHLFLLTKVVTYFGHLWSVCYRFVSAPFPSNEGRDGT